MNRHQLDKIIGLIEDQMKRFEVDGRAEASLNALECVEVEWIEHEKTLRIYIDGPGGVNLDTCAAVSCAFDNNAALEQIIPGSWNLEVSSPGLERPLRRPEHFRQFLGATVNVNLTEKISEKRHAKGKLLEVSNNNEMVTLETEEGPWSFPVTKLHRANIVYDWERSQTT
jgi:ribosome maturation factor RimP